MIKRDYLKVRMPESPQASGTIAYITPYTEKPGIFGVPLWQSIGYANVAISLTDANGNSFIYGYVPIVVAKCGVFLKEKGTCTQTLKEASGLVNLSFLFSYRCGGNIPPKWLCKADKRPAEYL